VTVPAGQTSVVSIERSWANAQLYTPWSPTLYGLQTTATVNGQIADQKSTASVSAKSRCRAIRFCSTANQFHGIGHEYGSDSPPQNWRMLDYHGEVAALQDIRDLGYTYLRRRKMEPYLHDLHDEIGVFTSLHHGPWGQRSGRCRAPTMKPSSFTPKSRRITFRAS
jgi:hypothetical protein